MTNESTAAFPWDMSYFSESAIEWCSEDVFLRFLTTLMQQQSNTNNNNNNNGDNNENSDGNDTNNGLPGKSTDDNIQYILNGYVLTVVIAVGVVCNIISMIIFCRPIKNSPDNRSHLPVVHIYLLGVTLWETLLLFPASFCLFSYPTLAYGQMMFMEWYSIIMPYAYCLSSCAMVASNWIMLALSVDRYFALRYPLIHFRLQHSNKRSYHTLLVGLISLLAFIYALPEFFVIGVETCFIPMMDNGKPIDISYVQSTEFSELPIYRMWYRTVGGIVFYSALPFTVILILTILIRNRYKFMESRRVVQRKNTCDSTYVEGLRRHMTVSRSETALECNGVLLRSNGAAANYNNNLSTSTATAATSPLNRRNQRQQQNGNKTIVKQNSQNNTISNVKHYDGNYMFLIFSMKFVITRGLCASLDVLEKSVPSVFSENWVVNIAIHVSNLLVLIGSATNFFVYWFYSSRFKMALKRGAANMTAAKFSIQNMRSLKVNSKMQLDRTQQYCKSDSPSNSKECNNSGLLTPHHHNGGGISRAGSSSQFRYRGAQPTETTELLNAETASLNANHRERTNTFSVGDTLLLTQTPSADSKNATCSIINKSLTPRNSCRLLNRQRNVDETNNNKANDKPDLVKCVSTEI